MALVLTAHTPSQQKGQSLDPQEEPRSCWPAVMTLAISLVHVANVRLVVFVNILQAGRQIARQAGTIPLLGWGVSRWQVPGSICPTLHACSVMLDFPAVPGSCTTTCSTQLHPLGPMVHTTHSNKNAFPSMSVLLSSRTCMTHLLQPLNPLLPHARLEGLEGITLPMYCLQILLADVPAVHTSAYYEHV